MLFRSWLGGYKYLSYILISTIYSFFIRLCAPDPNRALDSFHKVSYHQTFYTNQAPLRTMNGHTEKPISAGRRLRQLLSDPSKTVIAPGVYDGITARLALASGAECLYMVRGKCFSTEHLHPNESLLPSKTTYQR